MPRTRMKSVKRVRLRLAVPLLLSIVLIGAVALYAAQGGDPRDLPRETAAYLDGLAKRVRPPAAERQEPAGPSSVAAVESDRIAVYFAPGSRIRGGDIDDALLALLRGARVSIRCAFYDLEYVEAARVLVERHNAGVDVGIVSDSGYSDRDAIRLCIDAGIRVVFDDRRPFMHNKFCVVDDRIVWAGSTNITGNCLFRNDNNAVQIVSEKLAENYTVEFREMFDRGRFGPRSPRNTPYANVEVDGVPIRCLFAPEDGVRAAILDEIRASDTSITFMAFAFTSGAIAKAMAARMNAGVKVRGLFETRGAGSPHSEDDFLKRAGAEIHLDTNPNTMHNKVIVVDSDVVITGSYNFSANAEEDNDENVLILRSRDIAAKFEAQFEKLVN